MTARTVEFLLGRAGSGKSHRIRGQIVEELRRQPMGPPLYWVVPSDASYAAERFLLEETGAALRVEIVTLERLAERLLTPSPVMGRPVNQTGARLLLARTYHSLLPQLQALRREMPAVPFFDAILDAFREMSQYEIHPDSLEAWLEAAAAQLVHATEAVAASRVLMGKLRDLCLLYVHWRRALSAEGLYDPSDLMAIAASWADTWPDLSGVQVYVDGFSDLTPQAVRFLIEIAQRVERTVVALSMDPDWIAPAERAWRDETTSLLELLDGLDDPGAVYAPQTLALFMRLERAAVAAGLKVQRTVLGGEPPRFGTPDLKRVERWLFSGDAAPVKDSEAPSHIHIAAAQNPRAEAAGAAREVLRWVREEGASWADVAILVPDLDTYAPHLRDCLSEAGIPFTMDDFPSLATHPLGKYLLALLAAAEDGMSQDSAVRLLKSEFSGLRPADADWLETYVTRYEVEGPDWGRTEPWTFAYDQRDGWHSDAAFQADDARADELRRVLAERVLPVLARLTAPVLSPRALAEALWDGLSRAGAKRAVASWIVNEDAALSPLEASLHEQAWERVLRLLEDLGRTPSDIELPRSFLFELVRRDLLDQTLATIPARIGAVRVTELARAHASEAAVVLVLGAADGVLPRRVRSVGLLTDDERLMFARWFGRRLGHTTDERQLCERSTVYSGLTRARRELVLTYPLAGADGREQRPSLMVGRVKALFAPGTLTEAVWTDDADAGAQIWTEPMALRYVIDRTRRLAAGEAADAALPALFEWFLADPDRTRRLLNAVRGLGHRTRADRLPPALAQRLYGDPLRVNAYQLEAFLACPFRHFAAYGLRLSPEISPEPDAARRGALIHDALHAFVDQHRQNVEQWRSMTDEEAAESMRAVLAEVLERPQAGPWRRTAVRRELAARVESVLVVAAIVLTRHVRHGSFVPHSLEVSFGDQPSDHLPPFTVTLSDGERVEVRGRVDRIDVAEQDGRRAFRVVDYKSGDKRLDLTEVEHGISLQLPLYAAVVGRHSELLFGSLAEPAGILVQPVALKVDLKDVPDDERAARAAAIQQLGARAWLVDDRTLVGWMDARLVDGGRTELFPQIYRKDGTPAKNAPLFEGAHWRRLLGRVVRHVRDAAERMRAGDIAIAPYRLDKEQPCTYCPYAAVCQIDKRWDPTPIRRLEKGDRDHWLERWRVFETEEGQA